MPWEVEFDFEYDEGCPGDAKETLGWIDAFLDTIADAAAALAEPVHHERDRFSERKGSPPIQVQVLGR